jgi:hypothetical protein
MLSPQLGNPRSIDTILCLSKYVRPTKHSDQYHNLHVVGVFVGIEFVFRLELDVGRPKECCP